jgi:TonB family protein
MNISTKDLLESASQTQEKPGSGAHEAHSIQNPVSQEIPVRIQAARGASISRSGQEHAEPFLDEETATLILFPHGAVVRLSAGVRVGQVLVLTNRKTSRDVLCRVVNVKPLASVKGYIEIEFNNPVSGFWGVEFPQEPSSVYKPTASTAMPTAAPVAAPEPKEAALPRPSLKHEVPALSPAREGQPKDWGSPSSETRRSVRRDTAIGAELQNEALLRARRRRSAWLTMVVASSCFVALAAVTGVLLFRRYHAQAAALPAVTTAPSPAATAAVTVPTPVATSQPEGKPEAVVTAAPAGARPAPSNQGSALADMSPVAAALVKPETSKAPAGRHVPVLNLTGHAVASGKAAASAAEPPPSIASNTGASGSIGVILSATPSGAGPAPPPQAHVAITVPAHATYSPSPRYPMMAMENHIEGDVRIEAQIDAKGRATHMKVVSGPPLLYQAAMDALRQWKYEPSRLDGNPVDSQTTVTIQFRLK